MENWKYVCIFYTFSDTQRHQLLERSHGYNNVLAKSDSNSGNTVPGYHTVAVVRNGRVSTFTVLIYMLIETQSSVSDRDARVCNHLLRERSQL